MALIQCPECGKEISDKVVACPHCGYPLTDGSQSPPDLQRVEVTSVRLGPKNPEAKKKLLIGVVAVMIVIIVAVVSVLAVNKHKADVAKAEAERIRTEYITNLETACTRMLSGAVVAESVCNLTKSVWYNTIYEERDVETDKYTRTIIGEFNDDFNDSLRALFADKDTVANIDKVEENRESVAEVMRDLENPTEEFKSCHETLEAMYDEYFTLTDLAISPSGSLKTFSEEFSSSDSGFIKYYDKLQTQIPSIEEAQ